MVGEIDDEHDEEGDQAYMPIVSADDGWIEADGRAPLEELEAAIGAGPTWRPPDLDEEIDTVAGLVNALAGRVPQRREVIPHPDGFELRGARRRSPPGEARARAPRRPPTTAAEA